MSEESTTPDLVELVRGHFAAVNRRDFDAVESFYAPDAVLRGAEIGRFEGVAAIRGLYEDLLSAHEEYHVEVAEVVDLGNGVAFGVTIHDARPCGSSAEIRVRWAGWAIVTEGLIEQQTNYMDIDAARAAAERLAEERG
jgi:limonene-1,2-epoxide hydrolase